MTIHPALAFSTWRRPRGTVFRLANSRSSVLEPVTVGRCGLDCTHEHCCAVAEHTHTSVQDAFTQTHSSAQDASTQSARTHSQAQDFSTWSSWTVLPRRRVRSKKRSRTPDLRLDTDDSYAAPLSRLTCPCRPVGRAPSFVLLTLCGSSWPPPHPSSTGSAARLPDAVRLRSPYRQGQAPTRDASTAPAGKQNASPPHSPPKQDASTA